MKTKGEKPGPTHSLVYLGNALGVEKRYFQTLKNLSVDFVAARYPDITESVPYENYDEEIVGEYLQPVKELMEWIRKKLERS